MKGWFEDHGLPERQGHGKNKELELYFSEVMSMLSSGLQLGDFCKRVEIAWIGSVTYTATKYICC